MGAAWFHSFATCVGFRFWNIIYHHFQVVSLTVFHSFLGFCCCLVWFRHQKYWQCRIAQQQSEKISKSRQRAAGFLQTEDTNTTFSLNSSLPLCLFPTCYVCHVWYAPYSLSPTVSMHSTLHHDDKTLLTEQCGRRTGNDFGHPSCYRWIFLKPQIHWLTSAWADFFIWRRRVGGWRDTIQLPSSSQTCSCLWKNSWQHWWQDQICFNPNRDHFQTKPFCAWTVPDLNHRVATT